MPSAPGDRALTGRARAAPTRRMRPLRAPPPTDGHGGRAARRRCRPADGPPRRRALDVIALPVAGDRGRRVDGPRAGPRRRSRGRSPRVHRRRPLPRRSQCGSAPRRPRRHDRAAGPSPCDRSPAAERGHRGVVRGAGVSQELGPGRDVGPSAQQRTALPLGHPAPDPELDPLVERVREALGAHRADPAERRASRCLRPVTKRSSASDVRQRDALRQFHREAMTRSRSVDEVLPTSTDEFQGASVHSQTEGNYSTRPDGRTLRARDVTLRQVRPIALLLGLCLLAGVLVAGMAFPLSPGSAWSPTTRATRSPPSPPTSSTARCR